MSMVRTEHLTHVYSAGTPYEKTALNDVSISIEKGDFVGVIGHTGSGKSTFIQHLNGLLEPTSGKVFIDERDIWEDPKKIREFRFLVGLVFQYPEYQLFGETVEADIAFGPTNMGLTEEEIDRRVHEAARFVGIKEETLKKSPFELSGGQKRRVAIAGVLAMDPQVLVLDEPTAGLDPHGRDMILGQIKEYHEERGNTVLLVSHSMEDIAKYSEKAMVICDGEIKMFDTVEAVFSHTKELTDMGLTVPQVSRVFYRLRQNGIDLPDNIFTVAGAEKALLARLKGGRAK